MSPANDSGRLILAFDLYGTLLSTDSIAEELASHLSNDSDFAARIATTWRTYQLEYTWRLNSMNKYLPFSTVTRHSLQHALAEHGASGRLPPSALDSVMRAYDALSAFPDAEHLLTELRDLPTSVRPRAVVFSNGTRAMLEGSVAGSPGLRALGAEVFEELVSVEGVGRFKPDPAVYFHLVEKLGVARGDARRVWLVSGNPFDVVGAKAVGMSAAWVDRKGAGWVDTLPLDESGEGVRPDLEVRGLGEVLDGIRKTQR